jgi:hypothetical protein
LTGDDVTSPACWAEEKDWLVEVVMLAETDGEENILATLNWIGRVSAFAFYTDTRLLAQIGDPDMPAYELWFSFASEDSKHKFLELVRKDGFVHPDDELSFQRPEPDCPLGKLGPLASVFPEEQSEIIVAVMTMTLTGLGADLDNRNT